MSAPSPFELPPLQPPQWETHSVESFYIKLNEYVSYGDQIFPSTYDIDFVYVAKIMLHILESHDINYSMFPLSFSIRSLRTPLLCQRTSHSLSFWSIMQPDRPLHNAGFQIKFVCLHGRYPPLGPPRKFESWWLVVVLSMIKVGDCLGPHIQEGTKFLFSLYKYYIFI